MSAQIPEELIFEGENHQMFTEPLEDYREQGGELPEFDFSMTCLSRRYVGTWEIVNESLYLIAIKGQLKVGGVTNLRKVFPGCGARVFADWYSGTIRLPQGRVLQREYLGYCDTYERDLLLEFERGVLKKKTIKTNGTARAKWSP